MVIKKYFLPPRPKFVDAFSEVILEIEGSAQQRYKRALFPCKNYKKGTSDLSNPYVCSKFFGKNESLRAASESWTQFWPRITLDFITDTPLR